MDNFFGPATMIAGMSSIFFGTSLQIYKNWQWASCSGLSLFSVLNVLVCNILWFGHGCCIGDTCLIATNPCSIVLLLVILVQFFLYRGKEALKEKRTLFGFWKRRRTVKEVNLFLDESPEAEECETQLV